jgi:hypothetical protein
MWWALFTLLSCVTGEDYAYSNEPENRYIQSFVIGQPRQKSEWSTEPSIRICRDTEVSAYRINHAISYWEKLGYKFGSVTFDSSPTCMNSYYGEILITLPESGFSSTQMAATRVSTRISDGVIIKAKIFIMPRNAKRVRVLEHEIGHALGWSHYNQKFHIMHENWMLGGYDSKGLRNER